MQRILFAMVGSFTRCGHRTEHAGFMTSGMCIPLAADDGLVDYVESVGEDEIADMLTTQNGVEPPKSGGLWVGEFDIDYDHDPPGRTILKLLGWRMPKNDEISALLHKQLAVSERDKEITPEENLGKWVFYGAFV